MKTPSVTDTAARLFRRLDLKERNPGVFCGEWSGTGPTLEKRSPIDNSLLARVATASPEEYDRAVDAAARAFLDWRLVPPPRRGDILRRFGDALRGAKEDLGTLVTLETGKILAEGCGEIQEMIDICDFAVGLSRQLYGLTIASERPAHRLIEQWHPLGVVGIITAFNFPAAVWSWNSVLAAACGDSTLWKPSEKAPLTAIACIRLAERVCRESGVDPAIFSLVIGEGASTGEALAADPRVPLVSATGSCEMGRRVGEVVARRLGRSLLELGGNNAIIVTPSANLQLALRAVLFGAVGTAGQRCTSTRRLFVHESIRDELESGLLEAYRQVRVGNPLLPEVLMGPLIEPAAAERMQTALREAEAQGGRILTGGACLDGPEYPGGCYVAPCIVAADSRMPIVARETFAPILYLMSYRDLDEAIAAHNAVPQGLSSAIFTNAIGEAERFLSAAGSDCGLANVNVGTSGAEIGGAFGGEKDTGGGRESGSDSWKAYMRRQTATINASQELPLAQGIRFGE